MSSRAAPPPELKKVVFYIDECLSQRLLAAALRASGAEVVIREDRFPAGVKDEEWLPVAGREGWTVLTKDKRIRTRRNELSALMRAGVGAFVLVTNKQPMTGTDQAELIVSMLPRLLKTAREQTRPFVARIYRNRAIELDPPSRR